MPSLSTLCCPLVPSPHPSLTLPEASEDLQGAQEEEGQVGACLWGWGEPLPSAQAPSPKETWKGLLPAAPQPLGVGGWAGRRPPGLCPPSSCWLVPHQANCPLPAPPTPLSGVFSSSWLLLPSPPGWAAPLSSVNITCHPAWGVHLALPPPASPIPLHPMHLLGGFLFLLPWLVRLLPAFPPALGTPAWGPLSALPLGPAVAARAAGKQV